MKSISGEACTRIIESLKIEKNVREVAGEHRLSVGFVSKIRKAHLSHTVKSKGGRPCKITDTCSPRIKRLIICDEEKNAGTVGRRLHEERIVHLSPVSSQSTALEGAASP